jgi:phosphoketolase
MACAPDVPTLERLAAVEMLRQRIPDLKIRVINIVDLMTLQSNTEHPHGLSDCACRRFGTGDGAKPQQRKGKKHASNGGSPSAQVQE